MQLLLSKCNIIILCISIILIFLGITSLTFFSVLHEYIISSALEFNPDSNAFKVWRKPPTPITMDIYFFNWTNPDDIYNSSIKPHFVEMGPYRYKQFKEKTNITWNHHNQTVTYQYLKHFYFDEENSPSHHSDVITTINMVALTAALMARDWNIVYRQTVKIPMYSSKIYVKKTVQELMFEGFEDPILAMASAIPFVGADKEDRFGWFYGRNGSVGGDGVFNMVTSPDLNFGTLKNWNYKPNTGFYNGHCGDIYGSAGELYPRNLKNIKIEFFSPDMCRTVQLNFHETVSVKGIPSYKYKPGIELFDNGSVMEENLCFCNDKCRPSGTLNVQTCRQDAPIFLSLPHFYYADPSYLKAVEGLQPNKEKHELYITLEPNTGVIADIAARVQVNALLQPISGFSMFEGVPELFFPVFWFEQKVVMSDELASGLSLLFNLPNINRFVCIFIVVIGVLALLSVILYTLCYNQKKMRERKLTKEEIPLKS